MDYNKPIPASQEHTFLAKSRPKRPSQGIWASQYTGCHYLPTPLECAEMRLSWRSLAHCTTCGETYFLDHNEERDVHWRRVRWWNFSLRKEVTKLEIRSRGLERRGRTS